MVMVWVKTFQLPLVIQLFVLKRLFISVNETMNTNNMLKNRNGCDQQPWHAK